MKKPLILGTIAIIILPLLALACNPQESTTATQTTSTTATTATTTTTEATETTQPVITTTKPGDNETVTTPVPPLNGGEKAVTVEYSTDNFAATNNIVNAVELVKPGSLIVTLGANPTTGYSWKTSANISDTTVIKQESHNYVAPKTGDNTTVGAAGKDVWVFDSLKAGSSNITFSYSRPWEGGEKNTWTLVLNVTVKEKAN